MRHKIANAPIHFSRIVVCLGDLTFHSALHAMNILKDQKAAQNWYKKDFGVSHANRLALCINCGQM